MAFSQGDLDAIDRAIASGAQRVRYPDGSEIQYRTQAELDTARARIAAALAPAGQMSNRAYLVRF